jgi:ankyrin repeat protein
MGAQDEMVTAVQSGNAGRVGELLAQDASLASARDAQGVSALMHALYRRQGEALKLLLEKNSALDIFEAASTGDNDRVRVLLKSDPSLVRRFSSDGFTPLHFACYFGSGDTVALLLQKGAEVSAVSRNPMHLMPLHSAASARNAKAAEALLEHGADANAKQEKGWTPLHAAAQNGDQATADILLKHGADPHLANEDGVTAAELGKKSGLKFG